MLLAALINILGHDNRGDQPMEVLLMAAYGERGVLDRPNMRLMRWRNGALSGSDLSNEPGLGSSRTCNIRLLQSHLRLKKNRPFNHWLKSQGHYLLCFSTSNKSEPIRFACDMRLRPVTA